MVKPHGGLLIHFQNRYKIDKFSHRTSKGICGVLQGLTQNIRRFYFLSLNLSHFSLQPCCWTSHEWEQISQFPAEWFCCPCRQPPENNKNESWLRISEDFMAQCHKFQWQRNLWQAKNNIHCTKLIACKSRCTGFYSFSGLQELFKDPSLKLSWLFLRAHAEMLENESLNHENTCRPWTRKVLFWISVVLHKSNKQALGTVKHMPCIILQALIPPVLPLTPLKHFKVLIAWRFFNKKNQDFKGLKPISSTFKALKSDSGIQKFSRRVLTQGILLKK